MYYELSAHQYLNDHFMLVEIIDDVKRERNKSLRSSNKRLDARDAHSFAPHCVRLSIRFISWYLVKISPQLTTELQLRLITPNIS